MWSWTIPFKYDVECAQLKDEDGVLYADFDQNPLHLWSYSISIKKEVSFGELESKLYYSEVQPDAIPWRFKYYEKTWGFCVPYNVFKKMPKNKRYNLEIKSQFIDAPMKVVTSYVDYKASNDFLFVTNICHPLQVNDSISGLAVANELLKRLYIKPIDKPTHNVNFLFCPETIGSIAYLANNEEKIKASKGGIFVEMLGRDGDDSFILQNSINSDDEINNILEYVLLKNNKEYYVRPFERWNDEGVLNSHGVEIPTPFLMRGKYENGVTDFYKEYHTSNDSPDIISESYLVESVDILEEFLRIFCSNYIPIQNVTGLISYSSLSMHVAIEEDRETALKMEKLSYLLNGKHSVFEISQILDSDYYKIKSYIDAMLDHDVVAVYETK